MPSSLSAHRSTQDRPGSGAARAPTDAVAASGPFLAQRLAQESETEGPTPSQVSAAFSAYLRMRDSHIQLLSAYDAIDLRV